MHGNESANLQAFAVAGQGNFARAALHLRISPSTLSQKVRALESRLGIQLLNRTTRSMSLTETGEHLLERLTAMDLGLEPLSLELCVLGHHQLRLREPRRDAAQLEGEGSGKLLQDVTSQAAVAKIYGHPYLGPGMLASRSYCDREPFAVLKVLGAVRKAVAACRSMPAADVAAKLPAEFQGGPLAEAVRQVSGAFTSDGTVPLDAAAAMVHDMSDLKLGCGGIEPADTFDNRFIQAVNAGS